jgi:iron complex outermembrane receptor protein
MLQRKYLFGTTIMAGVIAAASPTFAQSTSSTSSTTADTSTESKPAEDLDVVIVGSRIRRDVYNSPSPVQVVTREEATLAGYASTTEVLQGTGITGGSAQINNAYGGFVTDGGPGANTLSLRGLGPTRTLVLLNGRRVSPAGSRGAVGSTDLNVLPTAIIERVEVLRDGASSIYGSDAIAGVVNLITRNNIDGVTVEGQYNFPTEANGAGAQTRFAVVAGLQGDRFHLSGSAEYYHRDELTLGDRDFTKCNLDYRLNRTTGVFSDYVDPLTGLPKCYPVTGTGSNGVTINTIGLSNLVGTTYGNSNVPGVAAPGGVGTLFNRFRPNSAITTGVTAGYEGVGGGSNNINVRDTFDPRTLNRSLISPVEIKTAYVEGAYDLHALGNAELYFETLATERESSQTGYRQLSLDYNKGSLLIPGNLAFSTFLGPQVTSPAGVPVGVRAFIGYGNDESSQDNKFAKVTGGIRGDLFIPGWRYDVTGTFARSHSDYKFDAVITNLLANSLNVVAAPAGFDSRLTRTGVLTSGLVGTVTCASNIGVATPTCIPAPFLNSQTIGGVLPQNFKDYIFRPVVGTTVYEEKTITAGIDGPLFSVPAGKVQAFLGAEFRDASIDDSPPLDSVNNNLLNLTTAQPTRGSDSVYEVYGEVEIPLLANLPLAQELTLTVSGRYTDYDSYGDGTTYKVGLVYTPFDWISLRSTYGTSFRAPALFEQFQGATSGFLNQSSDPCSNYDPATTFINRATNCASQGLPVGFSPTSGITVVSSGGAGLGALAAETSQNFTGGIVLQPKLPSFFGSVSFAVDYYKIEVDNGVSKIGASNILQRCYDSTPEDFAADNGFCRLISARAAGTNALTVYDSYTNVATDIVEGIDYNARFTRDLGPGRVLVNLAVTQFLHQSNKLFEEDPLDDVNGTIGAPEYTGTFDVAYSWDKFRVRYGLEWVAAMDSTDYVGATGIANYVFDVPDYYLHNVSVQYATDKFTVTAGVRNLFDEDLPSISQGAYNKIGNAPLYSGYDYVGRSGFINISKSF